MNPILPIIKPFIRKDLKINLAGQKNNLYIFDWSKWMEEHEKVMKQIEAMDDEEMSDFLSNNETKVMQINEYYMNDKCIEKVNARQWIPFAVRGLHYEPESFAEVFNEGILLFDLTAGDKDNPPILLSQDSEVKLVAKNFSELVITKNRT